MVFLLRHLKTINNEKGIISGQSEATIVESSVINDGVIHFYDYIFSSPSQRCLDTLDHLFNYEVKPTVDFRLNERNMGLFEGKSKSEAYELFPNMFIKNKNIIFNVLLTPPDGESFDSFYSRTNEFYNDIILPNVDKNILICSHNQTLKMLHCILNNIIPSMDIWSDLHFSNGTTVMYTIHN